MQSTPKTHGGRRAGAGRKKGSHKKAPTVVMRVPQNQQQAIRDFIAVLQQDNNAISPAQLARPTPSRVSRSWLLFSSKVAAGFPSPADDHVEKRLDPNDFLIDNEDTTFFITIEGLSMIEAGLFPGDKAVVDRAKPVKKGSIVLAVVNGDFTVKRLGQQADGRPLLLPENSSGDYQPILINDEMQFEIWGVVTGAFRRF